MTKLQPQLNAPLAFDPVTKLYWYTNLPLLVGNYRRQSEIIQTLNIPGFSQFRFATTQELNSLISVVTDASNAFVFTPTEYPTFQNSSNGPGFYWAARCGDVQRTDPGGMTFRNLLYFYCDPLSALDVKTSNQSNGGQFLAIEDHEASIQAPDLQVSAWVVCKKHGPHPKDPHHQ